MPGPIRRTDGLNDIPLSQPPDPSHDGEPEVGSSGAAPAYAPGMPKPSRLVLSSRLLALADRVAVRRVAGAAAGDLHDWLPLRRRWDERLGHPLADEVWWVNYVQGAALDPRLEGCVVQIVALDQAVAGEGPWPIEVSEEGRHLAVARFRLQRLDDDGFVEGEWTGGSGVRVSLRLGSRDVLRAHARRQDGEAWAVRLYRLLEVIRDWTPSTYQESAGSAARQSTAASSTE
jgi:hypothetical protein